MNVGYCPDATAHGATDAAADAGNADGDVRAHEAGVATGTVGIDVAGVANNASVADGASDVGGAGVDSEVNDTGVANDAGGVCKASANSATKEVACRRDWMAGGFAPDGCAGY